MAENPGAPHLQSTLSIRSLHLGSEDVHVWWASLNPPQQTLSGRIALLSADENARAERFYFERDRLRYIAGRSYLRILLGAYLECDPAQIEFNYSPLGKPALKTTFDGRVLQFNLSNSNNRVLYVFSWERQVGIDLERVHPMPDEDDFARQFFCASENALLRSFSGDAKRKKFFELWTCKEALLKAMGDGLTKPIDEVEVALQDGRARLVSIAGDPRPAADWQIVLFQPAAAYQAALAVEGQNWKSTFYNASNDFSPEQSLVQDQV